MYKSILSHIFGGFVWSRQTPISSSVRTDEEKTWSQPCPKNCLLQDVSWAVGSASLESPTCTCHPEGLSGCGLCCIYLHLSSCHILIHMGHISSLLQTPWVLIASSDNIRSWGLGYEMLRDIIDTSLDTWLHNPGSLGLLHDLTRVQTYKNKTIYHFEWFHPSPDSLGSSA